MSTTTTTDRSSDSSVTMTEPERDIESRQPEKHIPFWKRQFDQAGVTPAVLEWKYHGSGTSEDPYVVDFLPDDPKNPMKFPVWRKWFITMLVAIAVLAVAFVSTAYSGGVSEVIIEFQISSEVAILGISLFVVGFALGPLMWAPLSEMCGRQVLFFISYMALTAFNAGAAASPNITSLIVLRFFAGTFGSSPLTNSGGVIADMFPAAERGLATAVFATAPFLGPSIGPIVGGFLGQAAGWRWVEGLMAAFTGLLWIVGSLLIPETYAPVLLRRRASKLSQMTGKVYVSKLDVGKPKKTVVQEFKVALSRPWKLLFREPIVALTSLYMAIVYGTLYMMFAAFPIVFQQVRGWSPGVGGLAFLGVAVGMMFAVGYSAYDNVRYAKIANARKGMALPEARLPPSLIGSCLLPIGLFWFAWTNGPEIHWIVPIIASGFFAAGLVLVFLSLMNYLIDSYTIYAASVLAANSVLRSLFGAAFPLFTDAMYSNLGIHWASSIPAFLSLACLPFPFLFYKYGETIRMKCKFAAEAADVLTRMRTRQDDGPEPMSEVAAENEMEDEKKRETDA
ncbi:major facilitator superfamily transporter [Xylariomycetidae sp. FL0641]|nr:major facilitator superfamily transporter [Xylariomycetidae sp. FL0641]